MIIQTQNLTRSYGQRVGVQDVNISVPPGVVYGFLGPNGAGKSTTIRVLLGFLRPTHGRASIFGLDCWRDGLRIRRDIGYLPGDLRLYPWMNGRDALRFVSRVRQCDLNTTGRELAGHFNLELTVKVRSMSRGMRQKLGLVLALAHDPKLLILDEPTASLDPIMQEQLCDYLRAAAKRGRTVFFSSHTLSEVQRLCDRVGIVRDGRLVADESLKSLQAQAQREVTISWRKAAPIHAIQPPEFLQLQERSEHLWRGELHGPVTALLQWLAKQPIEDVSIGQPDLETLFRRYYQRQSSAP